MYLMYVDESGDTGLTNSPTRYFCLSGLVVHESNWRAFVQTLIDFRRVIKIAYGLPVRTEIHASEYINHKILNLARYQHLAILRNLLDELAKLKTISITNVVIDKQGKPPTYDVFEWAWKTLFQRFENTLNYGNFPGGHRTDHGMVVTDATNGEKLTRLVRRMAVHNHIPHDPYYGMGTRNVPMVRIIEDPHGKDSKDTLPIQAVDVCAYFLMQRFKPNGYIRKNHAQNYFDRLLQVLNTNASRSHPLGIVVL